MTKHQYSQVVLERVLDQNTLILEHVTRLSPLSNDVQELKRGMEQVVADIQTIKIALSDYSREQKDHRVRIQSLEAGV